MSSPALGLARTLCLSAAMYRPVVRPKVLCGEHCSLIRRDGKEVSMPSIRVYLLGDFRIVSNGELLMSMRQARMQSLLGYLLVHRDAPQSRQRLAFLFWPDTSESQARTNLRQLLHHLHRAVPVADHLLHIDTATVQWRPTISCAVDLADFETQMAQAAAAAQAGQPTDSRTAWEQAIALYRGDLFPDCYDDWILPERERLRQTYLGALERMIVLLEDQRDYPAAISYAERLLRHDPLHEQTYRRLMRLHALCGDRAGALRVYHTCTTTLERELGSEPHPDTQVVYTRLLHREAPTVLGGHTSPAGIRRTTMVGRHREWNRLRRTWQSAAAGHAALVLISGESGIGKTRLAEELLDWVCQQGIRSAHTRSYAAAGRLAYAPVADWLRTEPLRAQLTQLAAVWLTEVARLVPEVLVEQPDWAPPEPLSEQWQRRRLFEALARALLVVREPLLLVLDDAQWADQDTVDWLDFLLHFDVRAPVLIVATARTEELDPSHALIRLVLHLRNRDQATTIELGPLDRGDTAALAEYIARRSISAAQHVQLYRQTEGNPLFVVEIMQAALGAHSQEQEHPAATLAISRAAPSPMLLPETAGGLLTPKIHAIIHARLGQLSPAARHLANVAATIGRGFTTKVLAQASERDEETLVQAVDELWRRRLIREQGVASYDFSHDQIREVVYAEMSAVQRQVLHRRVAAALEHLHAADLDPVSAQIAAHYDCAGENDLAIAYYQRAAALAQKMVSYQEVISLVTRAIALLKTQLHMAERTQTEYTLLLMLAMAWMWIRGYGEAAAEQALRQAWQLCRILNDPAQSIRVLAGLWLSYHVQSNQNQAWQVAKRLAAEARLAANPQYRTIVAFMLAGTSFFRGDFAATDDYVERGIAMDDARYHHVQNQFFGYTPGVVILGYGGHNRWLRGYPTQAVEYIQRGIALAAESGHVASRVFALSMLTVLYYLRGEVALTSDHALATIALAQEQEMAQWVTHNNLLYGWALARTGQASVGIATIVQALEAWQSNGSRLSLTYYQLLLAEAYEAADALPAALNTLQRALVLVDANGERWMEAELHRRRGEVLLKQGATRAQVEACFQRALEIAQAQQARSLELRAAISMGRLHQRRGEPMIARRLLAEVYNWFSEGFETADLQEAAALLQAWA